MHFVVPALQEIVLTVSKELVCVWHMETFRVTFICILALARHGCHMWMESLRGLISPFFLFFILWFLFLSSPHIQPFSGSLAFLLHPVLMNNLFVHCT